ncbi:hypothetical protein [Lolliginicoccus suaedae]|uniref:hypothetical protein n=1 Tax=Lolliginicoccus suaedae TaxID=2605429 RepID=UPI001658C6D0|nr:hypothetical protein [Lolliginicoccus suaedae]
MNGVTVSADDNGLPTRIELSHTALRLGGKQLAAEILRQCHGAAVAGGVRSRQELAALGIDRRTLDAVGLPTAAELAKLQGPASAATMLDKMGITR